MVSAGRCVPLPKGNWSNTTTYYMLDIVTHNNIAWICKRECLAQEPTDGTYWQRFGSAAPIATTRVAGIVIPDGTTIAVANDGTISVMASLSDLADVDVTGLLDGMVLVWDATNQNWVPSAMSGGLYPHLIIISETGSVVTVTKGGTTISATETSTGHYECDVPEFGTWTIDAVLGGDDAQVSLVVDTVKIYTVDDSHFHADITVTYPTGAQVSCSKTGETTQYATGSPYTFTVHSAGTWTITSTHNGVTATEDVAISTSGQTESVNMVSKTITVDIYSAASDTVSFTDATGAKTATTNSSGVASGVSIDLDRYDGNITFTSAVAKDPSNLSADYSKTIALTDATTNVYVMPDDVIYWYGFEGASHTEAKGSVSISAAFNTNNFTVNSKNVAYFYNLTFNKAIDKNTLNLVYILSERYSENYQKLGVRNTYEAKTNDGTSFSGTKIGLNANMTKLSHDSTSEQNQYPSIMIGQDSVFTGYALWLE